MDDQVPDHTPESLDERLLSLMIHRPQGARQALERLKDHTLLEGADNQQIFTAIRNVYTRLAKKLGANPSMVDHDLVVGELQATGVYNKIGAEKVLRVCTSKPNQKYFEETVNLIIKRKHSTEKAEALRELKQTDDPDQVNELLKKINDLDKEAPNGLSDQILSRDDWMAEVDDIERLPECIPTGFVLLDEHLGGGFIKGNYHIIASPTGSGKTILMLSMWKHLLDMGIRSAYINYEIPRDLFMKYLFAQFTGTNVYRRGGIPAEELKSSKEYFIERVGQLYDEGMLMIADPMSGSPKMWEDLEDMVRYLVQSRGAECVWFDTINSVNARTKKGQDLRWNEYESIALSAEYLCQELNIPIIFSAQMDRDAGKRKKDDEDEIRRPQIGDVAGYKVLSEKAATIVHLHRTDRADKTRRINYSELVITKNRVIGQELGDRPIRVKYESTYKRMVEMPPDEQEASKVILEPEAFDGTFITPNVPGIRKHPVLEYAKEN